MKSSDVSVIEQQVVDIESTRLLCLLMVGIQSDDAGTLRCLKPGSYDSLVEAELIVQGSTILLSICDWTTNIL